MIRYSSHASKTLRYVETVFDLFKIFT